MPSETLEKPFSLYGLSVLAAALAALPWVFDVNALDPNLAPRLSFLSLLLLILSLLYLKKRVFYIPTIFWLLLGFIGLEALSLIYANSPSEVLFPLLRDSSMAILFLFVYQMAQQEGSIITIAKALTFTLLALASYAIYQIFKLDAWGNNEKLYEISSLMAHRNLLASALLLGLPWLIFNIYQSKLLLRVLGIFILISTLALIVFLESRTVWLAWVAAICAYFLSYPISKIVVRFKERNLIIGSLILLLMGTIVFSGYKMQNHGSTKMAQELKTSLNVSAEAEKNFTVSERVLLWKASLNMIWEASWMGVGAGHWKIFFPAYGSDIWRARQGMVQFQRPHNDFIWILSELGILGLLLYLFTFMLALYQAFCSLAKADLQRSERMFIQLLISGLIAYLVISFFSFPRERIFHQVILFINLAFITNEQRKSPLKLRRVKLTMLASLLLSLASLVFALNWWRGERVVLKMNQARANGAWQTLLLEHDKLADNYFYQIDAVSLPTSFYAGLAELNLQNYPLSEQYFEEAYDLHPYNIHVINNLANIKLLSGQADTAIYFYREALKVSPKYLDGALNLMAAYFNNNRVEEAYLVLCEYEGVFAVDDPDHSSLPYYRKMILKALQSQKFSSDSIKKSWSEKDLEEAHFKALTEKRKLFN